MDAIFDSLRLQEIVWWLDLIQAITILLEDISLLSIVKIRQNKKWKRTGKFHFVVSNTVVMRT